jgi:hypothetical protein
MNPPCKAIYEGMGREVRVGWRSIRVVIHMDKVKQPTKHGGSSGVGRERVSRGAASLCMSKEVTGHINRSEDVGGAMRM